MRRVSEPGAGLKPRALPARAAWAAAVAVLACAMPASGQQAAAPTAAGQPCERPVYLTFDTGHMGVADLIAEVLQRQHVKATFFLANEATQDGGGSLDDRWAAWWRARAAEGHVVGSHTFDHVYWRADGPGPGVFTVRPSAGPRQGQAYTLTAEAYCQELARPAERWQAMTGRTMPRLFRAPGGKTSPALLAAAQACGWQHVGWAPAGFLGDELSSEKYPNAMLLQRALRDIRAGDILVAHLGIWSRKEVWAPAVLEPLVTGLKQRGFCFRTLADHPAYRASVAAAPR